MSLTDQDARALIHLAKRLRQDTYGAGTWDQPGIEAEVLRLVGQDLAVSIERVVRHAADPNARTPGAIRRAYTPPAPEERWKPQPLAPADRCRICGKSREACGQNPHAGHEFAPDIREPHDYDVAPVIAELKGLARADREQEMEMDEESA